VLVATTNVKYKGQEVVISVFCPQKAYQESDEYVCSFLIKGGDIDHSGRAVGFDSMQSLILCLTMIGTYLQKNDEIDLSLMEWEGGTMKFPVFDI
jgi:hypothetical protein